MPIMNNDFDLLFHDYDAEKNNCLSFYHNFHDTNVKILPFKET